MKDLNPDQMGMGLTTPPPSAFLQIMPRLLNAALVPLTDKGMVASERALITYCSLHRLFLALAEEFNLCPLAATCMDRWATPALGSGLRLIKTSSCVTSPGICYFL